MRKGISKQTRFDCTTVENVQLNLECRDEIIPILRALQMIYCKQPMRKKILKLVAEDVNRETREDCGREGLDYWQILVLASVRLGCNLDYDKLQDLAEQHRALRHIMGIGDWDEVMNLSWRRIRDNVCLLRPETIEQINHEVVQAGHQLAPEAIRQVRADSFVVPRSPFTAATSIIPPRALSFWTAPVKCSSWARRLPPHSICQAGDNRPTC